MRKTKESMPLMKVFNNLQLNIIKKLKKGLKMLTCYGCYSSVHLFCHGINTPYNIEHSTDLPKREDYMYVCERCREMGPDYQPVYKLYYNYLLFINM